MKARHRTGGWTPPVEYLSEATHDKLLGLLGLPNDLDTSAEIRNAIEEAVAEYRVMHELLDLAPRPSEVRRQAEAIAQAASTLATTLISGDLSETTMGAIEAADPGAGLGAVKALRRLQRACAIALRSLGGDGRQRRTEHGRTWLVGELLKLSARVAPQAPRAQHKEFCRLVLVAACIPAPAGQAFSRLFVRVEKALEIPLNF